MKPRPPRRRARRKASRSLLTRCFVWLAKLAVVVIGLTVLMVLPLRWLNPPTSAFMLADDSGRSPLLYRWHDMAQLSDSVAYAVIAAEDQRFADHAGIDFKSISEALESAGNGGRLRGASTLSQQVAKNLYLWNGRSLLRKGLEAYLTLALELCLPKRRILELYLNIAELGPGVYGFGPASEYFFGKTAARLSDAEAALLVASLPNPALYRVDRVTPYMRERQRWILQQMARLRRDGFMQRL